MKQNYFFLAVEITAITPTEIEYEYANGPGKAVYEIRGTQDLDFSQLKVGQCYYIEGYNAGTNHTRYVWNSAVQVSKDRARLLLNAHRRNGKDHQYEPLPAELRAFIIDYGKEGYNAWLMAKDFNEGKNPDKWQILTLIGDKPEEFSEPMLEDIEQVLIKYIQNKRIKKLFVMEFGEE